MRLKRNVEWFLKVMINSACINMLHTLPDLHVSHISSSSGLYMFSFSVWILKSVLLIGKNTLALMAEVNIHLVRKSGLLIFLFLFQMLDVACVIGSKTRCDT